MPGAFCGSLVHGVSLMVVQLSGPTSVGFSLYWDGSGVGSRARRPGTVGNTDPDCSYVSASLPLNHLTFRRSLASFGARWQMLGQLPGF